MFNNFNKKPKTKEEQEKEIVKGLKVKEKGLEKTLSYKELEKRENSRNEVSKEDIDKRTAKYESGKGGLSLKSLENKYPGLFDGISFEQQSYILDQLSTHMLEHVKIKARDDYQEEYESKGKGFIAGLKKLGMNLKKNWSLESRAGENLNMI